MPSQTAILIASPSNRTRFATMAVGTLPDLHALDPAGRAVIRLVSYQPRDLSLQYRSLQSP